MPRVLVVGGAGYVGSHACKAFARAGWDVTVFDDLSRGWRDAVRWGPLIEGDLLDQGQLGAALAAARPDIVVHFAALAYVGESVADPARYYRVNSMGTLNLLDAMRAHGTGALIFSSTCASYGDPLRLPIDEAHPQSPVNPYGWSKLLVERMMADYAAAYGLSCIALRYFNAAGADPEGEIGERHVPETHLIPLAIEAALTGGAFAINGTDFPTPDGTAIRDFIHVSDLADAHVLAATRCLTTRGAEAYNLGTGTGTSVRGIIDAVAAHVGKPIRVVPAPRRIGDPATLIADPGAARKALGWIPTRSALDTIISTASSWALRERRLPHS
jgi:UDP-arabinose 4-epimerase